MDANLHTPPLVSRSGFRYVLIATLLMVAGGGAGFTVLASDDETAADPAVGAQEAPRTPHVPDSAEWAPPLPEDDAGAPDMP